MTTFFPSPDWPACFLPRQISFFGGFVIPEIFWAGQPFARMGNPRSHQYPGSYAASYIDANRMSKMPSLPSRDCIHILSVGLLAQSLSRRPFGSAYSRHPAKIFYQIPGGDRRVGYGAASSLLGWSVIHLRNVVMLLTILNALK